ncbi:NAD(P)H-dependent oxidoreductase [Flavonifractor plautii]|nr:NAD(P)H-dependent oxidoreductase [Flavonifractor plautii]
MENLLFINACVRGERSRTLKLARRFLDAYRAAHPDTVITERDLCADRLQPQYPEVLAERDALWSAGKLEQPMFEPARQFAAADKLVIAAPFWDMSFPAVLKIYLERISVTDLTFGYSEEGGHGGAVPGLQAALYHHPGRQLRLSTPMETATPVLKALCTMYGIPEFQCLDAEGLDDIRNDKEALLADAARRAEALAEVF